MADSTNDALQTYKVSGRKSPRGRVGEQEEKNRGKKNRGKKNRGKKNRGKNLGENRGNGEKTVTARKSQKKSL